MDKEKAIKILRNKIECLSHSKCSDCPLDKVCDQLRTPSDSEYIAAYGMAIEALSAEPCEDAISRQAVLDTMSELNAISFYEAQEDSNECYHEIRKAMEQLPPVTPKVEECEDAVSRDYLEECIELMTDINGDTVYAVRMSDIRQLPSVTPKQKMGRWIIVDDCEHFIAKCSECGRVEDSRMIKKYPYCHCGAKMAESED